MKETYSKLKLPTRKWFDSVKRKYVLEEHHERLLLLCCQAWDRAQQARAVLEAEGAFINDRFDQRKPHPAVAVERDSILTFTRVLREIGLDIERPDDSRPPSRPGGY